MSVLRSLLTAGVLASGLLWSLNGITATPAAQASDDRYEVTQQRNPDAACLDCHKPDTEGMHGKHASVINPNNKLPVTCTNCHGQPSPQHREGVKDVMRFNEPMYKVGEQNSVCMSCHLPEQLQKAFWPHDVHVTKVACASCHSLHPQQDTMQTLSDKGRIKICVDCHSDQRTNPNFNPASVTSLLPAGGRCRQYVAAHHADCRAGRGDPRSVDPRLPPDKTVDLLEADVPLQFYLGDVDGGDAVSALHGGAGAVAGENL